MMASLPVRDPVGDHLLTPQNAAMLVMTTSRAVRRRQLDEPEPAAGEHRLDREDREAVRPADRPFDNQRRKRTRSADGAGARRAARGQSAIDRTSSNGWEDADFLSAVRATRRIINSKTARSQLVGGMTWGLSMASHEESVLDPHFGDYVNHDFAEYHIASNADVGTVEVAFLDEDDPHVNPMGVKGIGELGIVGTAAAIANAVYHATGIRVRDLPIRLDKLLR